MVTASETVVREYLVSHGERGELGRFRSGVPQAYDRGDRVVVRTDLGLELGTVLGAASSRLSELLPGSMGGELLRLAGPLDDEAAVRMRRRGQELFEAGRQLAAELNLPIELLDVEVLLDGQRALVQHLRWAECDERPLVSRLAKQFELTLSLHDLTRPAEASGSCGKPDCGQDSGGCSSCGTGGCGTSCGSVSAREVQEYFAELRERMEERHRRPLL